MSRVLRTGLLAAAFVMAAASAAAEVEVVVYGSTGLPVNGLQGWLGQGHERDRLVVRTDEAPVYLLFLWDSRDLTPVVSITDAAGARVGDFDLSRGNRVMLARPGEFVCMLSASKGSGHWLCVAMSGRVWDR